MKCQPDCPMTDPALGRYTCNRKPGLYHGYCYGAPAWFEAGIENADEGIRFWTLLKQRSGECMAQYVREHGTPKCSCGAVVERINRLNSGLNTWRCPTCGEEYRYWTPWMMGRTEEKA